MSPSELTYYRERSIIERQRAKLAADPRATKLHDELADLYETLVELKEPHKPTLHVVEALNSPTAATEMRHGFEEC